MRTEDQKYQKISHLINLFLLINLTKYKENFNL